MYCTECGYKIEDGQSFCTNCGARLRQDAPAFVPAPIAPVEEVVKEKPKRAGLDVAMLVWSIMCIELCASFFSIPSLIITICAASKTPEDAEGSLKIAKGLNIVGMCCFAAFFLVFFVLLSLAYFFG